MAKDIQRALGVNIGKLRKAREWSQERMAEVCGMHWTYIGQVELEERNLTLQSIHAIARAFGIKSSELLWGVD